MKVDLECEFDTEDLAAIANHGSKKTASEVDVRTFIREAINNALNSALVEYKAAQNDPSVSVGP